MCCRFERGVCFEPHAENGTNDKPCNITFRQVDDDLPILCSGKAQNRGTRRKCTAWLCKYLSDNTLLRRAQSCIFSGILCADQFGLSLLQKRLSGSKLSRSAL